MTRHQQDSRLRRFLGDKRGTTAIEYALIAAGVAAVLVGAIAATGTSLTDLWTTVGTALR